MKYIIMQHGVYPIINMCVVDTIERGVELAKNFLIKEYDNYHFVILAEIAENTMKDISVVAEIRKKRGGVYICSENEKVRSIYPFSETKFKAYWG